MAIRISAIPRATPTAQVEAWIARLQQVAAAAAATMTGRT
jgi:hypothetical protein